MDLLRTWELRSPSVDGQVLPGYGWIFPLGNGEVNIGVGALATAKRPADVALRPLIKLHRSEAVVVGLRGSAAGGVLGAAVMGGAVSGAAGPNWVLIGDAAACVNPLNGGGIDYGLETGRLALRCWFPDLPRLAGAAGDHYARGSRWPAGWGCC